MCKRGIIFLSYGAEKHHPGSLWGLKNLVSKKMSKTKGGREGYQDFSRKNCLITQTLRKRDTLVFCKFCSSQENGEGLSKNGPSEMFRKVDRFERSLGNLTLKVTVTVGHFYI